MIASSPPARLRAASVSSIRNSIQSPRTRFATALSALPTCNEPVGLGAKRTRFIAASLGGANPYARRFRTHQTAAAARTRASPTKIALSIPWKAQKRLAGWYTA